MPETNTTILYKYLLERFGGSEISLLGSGWSSIAFQVDNMIVRFPKQDLYDYKKEQAVCNFLRDKTSILIPDTEICMGMYPYVKHEKICGKHWDNVTLKQLSDNSRDLLAQDIAMFLSTIHAHSCSYTAPAFIPVHYQCLKQSILKNCSYTLLKNIRTIYDLATKLPNQNTVLIHGDFFSQNSILNKNNRLYGVFDWCNCGAGDPIADFIPLYATTNVDFVQTIIHYYQAISNKKFDFVRLKKLYLLRSMYLLYWKLHNKSIARNEIDKVLETILQKAL